ARSRGKPVRFVWEGEKHPSHRHANINSIGDHGTLTTVVVRTFKEDLSEQGIYDLTGNVREWCRDRWAPYTNAVDPPIDPLGSERASAGPFDYVVRGGSFASYADRFRTTRPRRVDRDEYPTAEQLAEDQAAYDVGFRVVIEWPRR